jgi:predicted nucleotidyltransferase
MRVCRREFVGDRWESVGAVALLLPTTGTSRPAEYRLGMVDEALIAEAGHRLSRAAGNSAQVILFGSHARGDAGADSDLDFLVIEPKVDNRRAESVRLRRELRGLGVAADVVVVSADHVAEWGEVKSTMLHQALTEGRVLAAA